MNKYLKAFLQRGMTFGGFGPIVMALVLFIIEFSNVNISLSGAKVLFAVVSTYILAFVQAGASVFNQIEHWSIPKSLFFHFLSIYIAYTGCYLLNSWIPFDINVILIFTAIFIVVYFIVWLTVYLSVKHFSKKLNSKL